jgi:hypothetical protein
MKAQYSIDYIYFYIDTDIDLIKRRYEKAILTLSINLK